MILFTRSKAQLKMAGRPGGWGNGYVVIPPASPLWGRKFKNFQVHDRVSIAQEIRQDDIEHFDIAPEYLGHWLIGFHTQSLGDNESIHDEDYVMYQTLCMYKSIIKKDQKVKARWRAYGQRLVDIRDKNKGLAYA
jgi:hypothetical protein